MKFESGGGGVVRARGSDSGSEDVIQKVQSLERLVCYTC